MKALVKTKKGEGNIELLEKPIPEIGDEEVLIKVAYGGICGTDLHILSDRYTYYPPVTIGHEFSGVIVKSGVKVKNFKEGDKVVGEPHNEACGACYLCRTGNVQICDKKRSIGSGIDGAFAEYVKMPEKLLHKIPENVSLKTAAFCEPLAIVAHQLIERAKVYAGDYVVVTGAGPIAMLAGLVAKAAGARRVIMCGCTVDEGVRFPAALNAGAFDRFINVQKDDSVKIILDETGGIGADIVVECSGANSAIINAVKCLKKKGRLCAIGLSGKELVNFPYNEAMQKVIDMYFNMSSSYTGWEIALNLLKADKLNLDPLIKVMPLSKFNEAFDELINGKAVKIMLTAFDEYL